MTSIITFAVMGIASAVFAVITAIAAVMSGMEE